MSENVCDSSNTSRVTESEHPNTLLNDVLSTFRIALACLERNPYQQLPAYRNFEEILASVNKEFWSLLGFLYESKAVVLGTILLLSDRTNCSFTSLKSSFVEFGSSTEQDDANSESLANAIRVLEQLRDELTKYTRRLRLLYPSFVEIVDLLGTTLFHDSWQAFSVITRTTLLLSDSELAKDQRLSVIEMEMYQVARHFGKVWVDKALRNRKLEEVHIEMLKNIDNFIEKSLAGKTARLQALQHHIRKEVHRAISEPKKSVRNIVIVGMANAGKSLFLNAYMGRQLLPCDELPSTAWPCRLRHDPKARTPNLTINTEYFEKPLAELRMRKINAAMESYKPPSSNYLAMLAGDDDDDDDYSLSNFDESNISSVLTSDRDGQNGALYHDWKDLHEYTKDNLKIIEHSSFRLASSATGDKEVVKLLAIVNDIVRLCRIFKIDIPEAKPDTWPCLTVEFESLRDKKCEKAVEVIVLPGVGEAHSDFHSFEDFVRIAAKEADAVIPIISFKEISKGDWRRQLPQTVQTNFKRPPDFVLCTHMDQVQTKSRLTEQIASVGKEFWPTTTDFDRRVLRCSTRLGIGAHMLISQSQVRKPNFPDIWKKKTIIYECVEKILGVGDAKQKYEQLNREEWIETLQQQLQDSQLQDVMLQLTAWIVNSAQALQTEGKKLMLMMKSIAAEQERQLMKISCSQEEFGEAFRTFEQAHLKFKGFRETYEESKKSKNADILKPDRVHSITKHDERDSAELAVDFATKSVYHHASESRSVVLPDQVQETSGATRHVASLAAEFWPTITDFGGRGFRCSTRLGIGALKLISQSQNEKPDFDAIWNKGAVEYECVTKIFGDSDSYVRRTYEELTHEGWIAALQEQLSNSNLQDALSQLTENMVRSVQEGREPELMSMAQDISAEQNQRLVQTSRTHKGSELRSPTSSFHQALAKFELFSKSCEEECERLKSTAKMELDQVYKALEQKGQRSALFAVESAAKSVEYRLKYKFGARRSSEMVFENSSEVKKFYYEAQGQMMEDVKVTLIREFIVSVRELIERWRLELFELLVKKFDVNSEERHALLESKETILGDLGRQTLHLDNIFSAYFRVNILTNMNGFRLNKVVVDKDVLVMYLQEQVHEPFFSNIRKEAEKTMVSVITRSSQLAQKIVIESLQVDSKRNIYEACLRDRISMTIVAVSTFWNISAAESGLHELQTRLNEVP